MLTDKQIKQEFKKRTQQSPEKYYSTSVLQEEGFSRKQCPNCNTFFWTTTNQETCGDPSCSGGFRFIGSSPVKKKLTYIQLWQEFAKLFKKFGYTPIKRYPVVAKWRDDTDFVQASIYNFQPYVVNGEVDPPANPLVVPQFCLRFNDIDNVGITGAHYTGFIMIGQHMFVPPEKWDQDKVFSDIHNWLKLGLGLKNDDIIFHEDAWAGGGNFGPCMEFFSHGLELGNQVYMLYEQTPSGPKELKLKVLDMGMGHERNAWFTNATSTSYETTFPTVIKHLYNKTGLKVNQNLMKKFLPYSSYLNMDEVSNIEKVWKQISKKINVSPEKLKKTVLPLAALYSIAEHSRSLLFAINDGALPSNVGGGYNLRVILRRALSFIEEYNWDIDLAKLAELHASYLKPLFPELRENLKEVTEILEVEKQKYQATKETSLKIIKKLKKSITEEKLIQLYDSNGITPETIKRFVNIKIPEDFYAKVAARHEKKQISAVKESLPLYFSTPETEKLYYNKEMEFKAVVLKIIGNNVILNKTAFYPTSGGQAHDIGFIEGSKVINVYKEANIIIHKVDEIKFNEKQEVSCKVDPERRLTLTQFHTATHIINGTAKKLLGNHIWQAGAEKSPEKARLDITHYAQLTDEQLKDIEKEANKIISRKIPITKTFMSRNRAERLYGMKIYQGGAVPGKQLRIVNIKNFDIEACGGTHLDNTKDVKKIKLLKASKIQDGIVRLEFVAGSKALEEENKEKELLNELSKILKVNPSEVPERAKELFEKWKLARKNKKFEPLKIKKITKGTPRELLQKTAEIFKTQIEHLPKTASRFLKDIK